MAIKNSLPPVLPFTPLTAVTPLDGRYAQKVHALQPFVSEYALIKTRLEVEIHFLLALSEQNITRNIATKEKAALLSLITSFSLEEAKKVKEIEAQTRHDVKAVERYIRKTLANTSLSDVVEMIHMGLTSEDINNISYRLMAARAVMDVLLPKLKNICATLATLSDTHKSLPCIARTHGQSAVPTTLGKEVVVFAHRLAKEIAVLKSTRLTGKLNGAVGNFNALHAAYPQVDWLQFSHTFISSLRLHPNLVTTQINTYEDIISLFQTIQRVNNILIDFNQDMWRYISDGWFSQEVKKGEVGSSTMPQKVNPIDFENSEGNLGLANTLCEFFTRKLSISRLQRDLSDSTVIRNIGTTLGYSLLGYESLAGGLTRVTPNSNRIQEDLEKDWSVLAEGAQTILRRHTVADPYTMLLTVTRGKQVDENEWKTAVNNLPVDDAIKEELITLTPFSYIGLAEKIVSTALNDIKKIL